MELARPMGLPEICLKGPMRPYSESSHEIVLLVESLAPKHMLLASTRGSVNQGAPRRAATDPGSRLNLGHLSGSQGATSSLKATARARGVGWDFFADPTEI